MMPRITLVDLASAKARLIKPHSRRRRGRAGDKPWPGSGEPAGSDGRSLAEQLQRRAEAYLDLAMQAQVDFLDYKRRITEEFEQKIRDVNLRVLLELLPIVDDFRRAFASVPNDLAEHSWPQGIALIGRKLDHVLEQQGLEQIGREGDPFDPHIHEAVAYEEHPVYSEGLVARVSCSGYRLDDHLLRPAQVVVARGEAKQTVPTIAAPGVNGDAWITASR
jgi:molecular chaperone GrpE